MRSRSMQGRASAGYSCEQTRHMPAAVVFNAKERSSTARQQTHQKPQFCKYRWPQVCRAGGQEGRIRVRSRCRPTDCNTYECNTYECHQQAGQARTAHCRRCTIFGAAERCCAAVSRQRGSVWRNGRAACTGRTRSTGITLLSRSLLVHTFLVQMSGLLGGHTQPPPTQMEPARGRGTPPPRAGAQGQQTGEGAWQHA